MEKTLSSSSEFGDESQVLFILSMHTYNIHIIKVYIQHT